MSKTILTNAFATYKAQCETENKPIVMNEFVFALVPDQDINDPINPDEILPPDNQIKGRFPISQKGMINPDAVVYSIILGTDIGTWDFNWIGLVNSETNLVGAITHVKTQSKTKSDKENNIAGDTLNRNIVTPYTNASALTQITVSADVWQLDFNNRLLAIDERFRIDNIDLYDQAAFIGDSWKASSTNGAISLSPGVAYIGGLRCENTDNLAINVNGFTPPVTLYVEASFTGQINSAWEVNSEIVIAKSHPETRTENGVTYYSAPIAIIESDHSVKDLRVLDWRTDHLDPNQNPHPQYENQKLLDNFELYPNGLSMSLLPIGQTPNPQWVLPTQAKNAKFVNALIKAKTTEIINVVINVYFHSANPGSATGNASTQLCFTVTPIPSAPFGEYQTFLIPITTKDGETPDKISFHVSTYGPNNKVISKLDIEIHRAWGKK
ncbi:phage tail-collar fiber domain-containing protein [Aliivibrio fischeri]|uniref:Phage tail fibre protein N-terminal domain-containing protein n=1 Tax=Aliivibrio fischeri TaxID=668 RepID=A0A510UF16_ALIFS|nr:phage tail protein [Aliivibrio fischeri]GEK13212.1 hypothetical protein AFI02nite_12480 [Aliivibrio fischeri]